VVVAMQSLIVEMTVSVSVVVTTEAPHQ
jgi:hypothetical protein